MLAQWPRRTQETAPVSVSYSIAEKTAASLCRSLDFASNQLGKRADISLPYSCPQSCKTLELILFLI